MSSSVTWTWIERVVSVGGVVVAMTLYIAASRTSLERHEAVDTEVKRSQAMVDSTQNTRLDKLELLVEKALVQQQETVRSVDRLVVVLEQQQARKP